MYRPKKYQRLEPLARTPRVADVRRLLEAGTKARSCTVEQPWRSEKMKLPFSLTVRVEVGGSDPIWTLYEGEGSNSRVMWSTAFSDVDLLYDVLTLSLPSDGPNIFDPANRAEERPQATESMITRPASFYEEKSSSEPAKLEAELPPHLRGDDFFTAEQASAFEPKKSYEFDLMGSTGSQWASAENKWADESKSTPAPEQTPAPVQPSAPASAGQTQAAQTSTVPSVAAVEGPVPAPYLQNPVGNNPAQVQTGQVPGQFYPPEAYQNQAQGQYPQGQYPQGQFPQGQYPVQGQYPQPYPPGNWPANYPYPPGYSPEQNMTQPGGYPPGYYPYPPNSYQMPPGYPFQNPQQQPGGPNYNYPPNYPYAQPGAGYGDLNAAATVPLTPGLAPSDNAAANLMPSSGAGADLIKKRPNVMLGTLLVEADLVPKTTIDAALQVQTLVSNGSLSAMKAAEAVRRAHQRGGFLDAEAAPVAANESVVRVRPQLGQVLVMAGIISAAQLKAGLHLQGLMRTGAIEMEAAVLELRKELGPQDRATTPGGKKHEPEEIRKALELVRKAGLISDQDYEAAVKVRAKHGGELSRILIAAGKLDELTVEAAAVGQRFIEAGKLRVDQGIMTLHYCQRMRVGFEDAMHELNIELAH